MLHCGSEDRAGQGPSAARGLWKLGTVQREILPWSLQKESCELILNFCPPELYNKFVSF